ncbi:MAG: hypothetical protein FWC74_02880 [Candidatus Bathyarchaeota archaeon]|nr:hypothetical protein [Candidatus Termitimicrobium sp.]MDR0471547.1 hypothetical protein [Nitrososphaerota archaeon]
MPVTQTIKPENAFWISIQSQNRIRIPKNIVEYLGVQKGDQLKIKIIETHRLTKKPRRRTYQ